jgi:hypothetical protein
VARRGARLVGAVTLAGAASIVAGVGASVVFAPAAFADTQPYELYCPGTPVGDVVINGVTTTGTITPASPAAGGTFNVTNYQTNAAIPTSLVTAAQALGNTAIAGNASTQVDATGATPATLATPPSTFTQPIPSPVPAAGLTLNIPAPPGTVGPFTATGGAITLKVDSSANLTLTVSGSPLALKCTAYANNTVTPSGLTHSPPSGTPVSPQLATATTGGGAPAPAPAAPTATTTPPTSPAASTLPQTGPGPGLYVIGFLGLFAVALATMLFLAGGVTRRFAQASANRRGGSRGPTPPD